VVLQLCYSGVAVWLLWRTFPQSFPVKGSFERLQKDYDVKLKKMCQNQI
jgi:hypothetical protein